MERHGVLKLLSKSYWNTKSKKGSSTREYIQELTDWAMVGLWIDIKTPRTRMCTFQIQVRNAGRCITDTIKYITAKQKWQKARFSRKPNLREGGCKLVTPGEKLRYEKLVHAGAT